MAFLEKQEPISVVDWHLLAGQTISLAHAFPKIIPGWGSFVVQMKTIYHSHAAVLVIEKTI